MTPASARAAGMEAGRALKTAFPTASFVDAAITGSILFYGLQIRFHLIAFQWRVGRLLIIPHSILNFFKAIRPFFTWAEIIISLIDLLRPHNLAQ